MAEQPDRDQQTEAPTDKRKREAVEQGDVLQSRDLGTALVVLAGAAWLALAGPWALGAIGTMLGDGLSFNFSDINNFDPGARIVRLLGMVALPLIALLSLTVVAAIAAPAVLGSLGFRWGAIAFKGSRINPGSGLKRIFGVQGLIELGKSIAKIALLAAVGWWLLSSQAATITSLGSRDVVGALGQVGHTFTTAVLVMAVALALIAGADIPAQLFQRGGRLRMSKQQVREEHKESEGSPEMRGMRRRRQMELLQGSARSAVKEATVVLTNPTHFAVALRYRAGIDAAPSVVARGRGETAAAIRELAKDNGVPILSYPALTRAIYFTSRTGAVIREDLYLAVASVLAFVYRLDAAVGETLVQPDIDVPADVRFDEDGRRGA